jgi:DNA-binding SARP family transcriptional activator
MLIVRVLGALALELDERPLDSPARRPARLLLGYLALRRGAHSRGDLARLLWPDVLESSAKGSLRSALAASRRALGPDADRYLLREGDAIGLAGPELVSVDAERFDALAADGRLDDALALVRGPLLQGLDADFVRELRADHRARVSDVLGELAAREEERGSLEDAIRYTRRQVALDPLAEPPNRDLIRRLAAAGDRASALGLYAELAERFRRELRAAPSPQTRRLAEEVRAGEAGAIGGGGPLALPAALRAEATDRFVDRSSELRLLDRALTRAAAGERQVVLVSGPPGIGKTALVARAARSAAAPVTVLLGRCSDPPSAPFEPFVDALRHYARSAPVDRLERDLPAAAAELSVLVPEIGERVIAPPLPQDLLADGGRLPRAIVDTLLAACRDQPVALIVEDVHAASPATLRLIGQLLSASDGARLALVVTLRSTELGRSPALQRLVRQVRQVSGAATVSLEPFDLAATAGLARAHRGVGLDDEAVGALHARSGGNPFFATELLFSESPLPASIQDAVLDEVGRLGEDARTALSVASVVGEEFDLWTVARVAGWRDEAALDALDEAVVARVARELPGRAGRYAFRHALIREALYAGLTAARRAHLHRRIVDALEQRAGDDPPEARAVVEHLERAGELVSPAELAGHTERAAAEAAAQRAYDEAATLYARAARLLEDDPDEAAHRCALLIACGHARRRAGEGETVREAFLEAGRVAARLGDTDLVRDAALGICSVAFFPGDQAVDALTVQLLEHALEVVPESEASARARLLARLASERYHDAPGEQTDRQAADALALARRSGDPRALAAALDVACLSTQPPGGARERAELSEELVRVAREDGDGETLVPALVRRTIDRVELGDVEALEAGGEELARLAAELRQPAFTWWTHLWRATSATLRGRIDEGERHTLKAYEVGRTAFGDSADVELRAQLAWSRLEQGRLSELAGGMEALDELFSELPSWLCMKARILCEIGRDRDADATVDDLMQLGLARLETDSNWLISAALLAEVCVHTQNADFASRLRAALEPRRDQWSVSARGTLVLGPLSGSLALLCEVEGRSDEAARYLDAALARCRAAGARSAAARLRRELRLLSPAA